MSCTIDVAVIRPRILTVYVDESGNTGDAAASWHHAFGGQRAFCLAGVTGDVGNLAEILASLRERHGVRASEFKARVMKRHPGFVRDLLDVLAASKGFFVELMDKKFYLATTITSFALRGPEFEPFRDHRIANAFADAITERVDDAAVGAYATFAEKRDLGAFTTFVRAFRGGLLRGKLAALGPHEFRVLQEMGETFEAALHARGAEPAEFLPAPDHTAAGQLVPLLPHVPALANLAARANAHASHHDGVRFVHDEQLQFGPALGNVFPTIESVASDLTDALQGRAAAPVDWHVSGRAQLEFVNSVGEPGVLMADVLARYCAQRLTAVLTNGAAATLEERATLAALGRVGLGGEAAGVNVVATTRSAREFWGA